MQSKNNRVSFYNCMSFALAQFSLLAYRDRKKLEKCVVACAAVWGAFGSALVIDLIVIISFIHAALTKEIGPGSI
jgi:hypothetical protein